ncbi:CBS domain-containing protein [Tepidibacillus fermentans]|uniref:CBS domain protein n=1 Tax=Tepidibacillus fermentans TaxID=1281767 RepID=A0A4R3KBJ0_9BACI|nr:CBS domain-containing protein [Tepidibacillus fermentans]TCS80395.1 CBS domain protein [Tepidibacillus fermentans]
MRNSDRFLIAFNSIEKILRKHAPYDHYVPFSRLIGYVKKYNPIVMKYYDDLKEFSDLRNAIVHDSIDVNYAIAEPHDQVVQLIEKIEQELRQPMKVVPLFQKKVTTFQSTHTLKDILRAINTFSYSKFPIYDKQKFLGLLTKDGITNWIAKHVDKEPLSFSNVYLKDVLTHEKKKDENYRFIHQEMNIYDIKDIFRKNVEEGTYRIDALLITEHGDHKEPLLGIITLWDMMHLQ